MGVIERDNSFGSVLGLSVLILMMYVGKHIELFLFRKMGVRHKIGLPDNLEFDCHCEGPTDAVHRAHDYLIEMVVQYHVWMSQ